MFQRFWNIFFPLHEYMKQVIIVESRRFNDDRSVLEFLQRRDKIRSFTRGK